MIKRTALDKIYSGIKHFMMVSLEWLLYRRPLTCDFALFMYVFNGTFYSIHDTPLKYRPMLWWDSYFLNLENYMVYEGSFINYDIALKSLKKTLKSWWTFIKKKTVWAGSSNLFYFLFEFFNISVYDLSY